MEEPFFFKSRANRLFGVKHIPDRSLADSGIVLIHAFGEEKLWSHRVLVNFARAAASRGYPVLRFDLSGHGDSDGQTEACTVETYLADIDAAKRILRSDFPSIESTSLLGLRFGASLACLSAARSEDPSPLVLWEPVMDGARYMQELLRINLSTQLAVYGSVKEDRAALVQKMKLGVPANVDGYLISNDFFDGCSNIALSELNLDHVTAPIIVTQIAPNIRQKDRPDLVNLAHGLADGNFFKVEEPPFWREIRPFTSRTRELVNLTLDHMESWRGK